MPAEWLCGNWIDFLSFFLSFLCHISLSTAEMRLMAGDELRLRYTGELHKEWSGVGHVSKVPHSILSPTVSVSGE